MKRGQVSIFVILGIVITIGIFSIIFYSFNKSENENVFPRHLSDSAYNEIQSCLEEKSSTSIYFNLLQGGYYQVSEPKIVYEPIEVPLYWKEGESYFPSVNKIENEIIAFLADNIESCINNYDSQKTSINTKIIEDRFNFIYEIPISVQNEDISTKFEHFEININSDFYEKYFHVQEFLEFQKTQKGFFPLGYLTNLAFENNFKFEILEVNEQTKIVSIILNGIDERGPVAFNYAVGYKITNETNL